MRNILRLLLLSGHVVNAGGEAVTRSPQPVLVHPDVSKTWILDERFSDEFDSVDVNEAKWDRSLRPWGERSWTSDNVFHRNGRLVIRAHYEEHQPRQKKYFYKLGILRSRQKTTYGYFEARIKGCSRFPGLCPGFWLYSYGKDRNPKYPNIAYSEIDIVELQQGLYQPQLKRRVGIQHIDLNLHTRLLDEEGQEQWVRPNDSPEICRGTWNAPWDPRDDFHLYAVENSPEKIVWYIDGVKVAQKKNLYWHLPMSVTFTMELRPPLIDWAGVDGRVPVPEASTPEGFPTEMEVDYVRCWIRKPDTHNEGEANEQ